MEKYIYTAYDSAGSKHQGELSAVSLESAAHKLKGEGLIPVKIDTFDAGTTKMRALLQFRRTPSLADIEFLTSQLSLLLRSGIKIDRALKTIQKGGMNTKLRTILDDVYEDIRRGVPLSLCLEKNADLFDPVYVSIVRIGEATGRLADVFEYLAANLSFRQKVLAKTRQAMIYPSIILLVCFFSIVFILNFIIPRFATIFTGMKTVPFYTNLLLVFSDVFTRYQFLIFPLLICLAIFLIRSRKKYGYKRLVDLILIKVPILRQLCYSLENLRFVSALAILLKSGVLLTEALDHAVKSVGNVHVRKKLLMLQKEVKEGNRLSDAIARTAFLPDTFTGLIEIGEQTGNLSGVFSEMEERLRASYENRVTSLITLVEPVLIILMGLIVGSVVVAMLLSMVTISDINF
jgi:type II secretory pathway component PulF